MKEGKQTQTIGPSRCLPIKIHGRGGSWSTHGHVFHSDPLTSEGSGINTILQLGAFLIRDPECDIGNRWKSRDPTSGGHITLALDLGDSTTSVFKIRPRNEKNKNKNVPLNRKWKCPLIAKERSWAIFHLHVMSLSECNSTVLGGLPVRKHDVLSPSDDQSSILHPLLGGWCLNFCI